MNNNISKNILSGAIWTSIQTLGNKFLSMIGQLVIAWILLPSDFGKISIVYTLVTLGIVLQNFGLTDVLISRGKSFNVLIPLAKSLTLIMAAVSFFVVIILGFLGGIIYKDIQITYLVFIFSISIPFNTFSVIPDAKLRHSLKFKDIALTKFYSVLLTQILTIIFAIMSFGVYSFVFPLVIVSIINYFYLNYLSEISIKFKFTLKRWKHLVNNSVLGFVYAVCQRVIQQFDFAVLGLFALQAEVGVYYLAFSLSVQAIGFLVGSISPVLFPALKKVPKEDTIQLKHILLKMATFFALIGMPFALWQAVSAKSLITLFLPDKWHDCILLVQILSLGVGFQVVSSLWTVALLLKSEFKKQAFFSILSSFYFLILVISLSYLYKSIGTAVAVALFNITSSPLLIYFSFKNFGVRFIEVFKPFFKYYFFSLIIFGSIFYISTFFEQIYINFFLNVIVSPLIYFALVYFIDKDLIKQLLAKFKKGR